MRKLRAILFAVITCSSLLSVAGTQEDEIKNFFWQSNEVQQQVNWLASQGYSQKRGETYIVPKHTSVAPYGVSERSFLVSQVFVWNSIYPRSTSLVAIVSLNSYGKPSRINVLSLPKGGPNDLKVGTDEN